MSDVLVRVVQRNVYEGWEGKTRQKWVILLPSGGSIIPDNWETPEGATAEAEAYGFTVVKPSAAEHEVGIYLVGKCPPKVVGYEACPGTTLLSARAGTAPTWP